MKNHFNSANVDQVVEIYNKTGRAALSKIRYLVNDTEVAEEILQEVFLKLWSSKLSFPSQEQAFSWIYKASHNAAIDHLRSQKRRKTDPTPMDLGDTIVSKRQEHLLMDIALDLKQIVSLLKKQDSAIYVYNKVDQMTQQEIAALLRISRSTVARSLAHSEKIIQRFNEAHHGK